MESEDGDDLKQVGEEKQKRKEVKVSKNQTVLRSVRMATEFGTIQVKMLTEECCDDDFNGWYQVTDFEPSPNHALYEKYLTWNYAKRLIRVRKPSKENEQESPRDIDECEMIVLRETEARAQLGFELPRNGLVHISKVPEIDEADEENRPSAAPDPLPLRSSRVASFKDSCHSDGDNRLSNTRNVHAFRESRMLANVNLGSLSVAQPILPSTVFGDIESMRKSYSATIRQRDAELDRERSSEKLEYRQSLQRRSTVVGFTGEKNYNKIFPKTAPIKYNKSALPKSDVTSDDDSSVASFPTTPSRLSNFEKQDKHNVELMAQPSSKIYETDKIRQSKKFSFSLSRSFIEIPRDSEESVEDQEHASIQINKKRSKLDSGSAWKEISWEEKLDDESDSYIELDGSILSLKELQSENELEIVVYAPASDCKSPTQSETISPSDSTDDQPLIRYVPIPRKKIEDFLKKGIGQPKLHDDKRQLPKANDDGSPVTSVDHQPTVRFVPISKKKIEDYLKRGIGTNRNEEGTSKNEEGTSRNKEGLSKNEEGMSKNDEGTAKNEKGKSKNEEGTAKNEKGMSKNEEGTAKNEEGMSKNKEKMYTNEEGPSKNEGGRSKNEEGTSKSKEGMSKNEEGTSKNEEGLSKNEGGTAKNEKGRSKNEGGTAKNEGGTKNKEGTSKNEEERSKNEGGRSKNEEGRSKNEEGRSKNEEGTSKNEEGQSKNEGGTAKNKKGTYKKE